MKKRRWCAGTLGLILLGIGSVTPVRPALPPRIGPRPGDGVPIGLPGQGGIFLATTDEAYARMLEARITWHSATLEALERAGKIVPVPGGTKAKILEVGPSMVRVRIVDGPDATKSGWLPMELVP